MVAANLGEMPVHVEAISLHGPTVQAGVPPNPLSIGVERLNPSEGTRQCLRVWLGRQALKRDRVAAGICLPLSFALPHVKVHRSQISGRKYSGSSVHAGMGVVSAVKPAELVPKVKVVDQSESTVPQPENEQFTYAEFGALLDHPPICDEENRKRWETQLSAIGDHHHIQLSWPHLAGEVRPFNSGAGYCTVRVTVPVVVVDPDVPFTVIV